MSLVKNEAAKPVTAYRNSGCAANGCPMPGSITDTTKPQEGSQWLCRFHFNEPVNEWRDITRRVRQLDFEQRAKMCFLPVRVGR